MIQREETVAKVPVAAEAREGEPYQIRSCHTLYPLLSFHIRCRGEAEQFYPIHSYHFISGVRARPSTSDAGGASGAISHERRRQTSSASRYHSWCNALPARKVARPSRRAVREADAAAGSRTGLT